MGHSIHTDIRIAVDGQNYKVKQNCKYVIRLPSGDYIYEIHSTETLVTCKSRIRARQFNLHDAQTLQHAIQCELVPANWERVP